MKIIKILLITLVICVLLTVAIGFFLPSKVHVERSQAINAPSEIIHEQINNLKNWNRWSPWYKMDTAVKIEYNGIDTGAGASYKWASMNKKVGSGSMTITSSSADSICTAMDFMENGIATGKFVFLKENNTTKITWMMEMDMGMNPIGRIFGLFMDKMIGPDFESGLANLKQFAESIPVKPKSKFEVVEEDAAARVFIIKKDSMSWDSISSFFGKNFPAITEAVQKAKLETAGSPTGLYFIWDETTKSSVMAAAVPVKGDAKTKVKGFETYIVPAGKNLHIACAGGYTNIGDAHMEMDAYMKEKNLLQGIPVIEEYVTGPDQEPDSTKWLTHIFYPVK